MPPFIMEVSGSNLPMPPFVREDVNEVDRWVDKNY